VLGSLRTEACTWIFSPLPLFSLSPLTASENSASFPMEICRPSYCSSRDWWLLNNWLICPGVICQEAGKIVVAPPPPELEGGLKKLILMFPVVRSPTAPFTLAWAMVKVRLSTSSALACLAALPLMVIVKCVSSVRLIV